MNAVFLLVVGYLLGSLPSGYWVVKYSKGIDLRKVGSGSTGSTNVLRTAGKKLAGLVFFVDILKGYIAVWLSIYAFEHGYLADLPPALGEWVPFAVALAALVGHSKSIFLQFKGGKSAATGLGTMMAMNFPAALCAFAVFLSVLAVGRIVSLSSICAVTSSAIFMYLFHGRLSYIVYCACGAAYVTFRHKANIQRLLSGKEPKIGQKLEEPTSKQEPDSASGATN